MHVSTEKKTVVPPVLAFGMSYVFRDYFSYILNFSNLSYLNYLYSSINIG